MALFLKLDSFFVPEPADNSTLHRSSSRYAQKQLKGIIQPTEEEISRRGGFNMTVLFEVLDSLIQMAENPTGFWREFITSYIKNRLPM
jgi:hypothetical protein